MIRTASRHVRFVLVLVARSWQGRGGEAVQPDERCNFSQRTPLSQDECTEVRLLPLPPRAGQR